MHGNTDGMRGASTLGMRPVSARREHMRGREGTRRGDAARERGESKCWNVRGHEGMRASWGRSAMAAALVLC